MKTKPSCVSFDAMIELLRSTDHGKLLDSLIRVELGQDVFMAAWDAFKDIADYFDEEYFGDKAMLNQFLITMEDEIRFSDLGLKLCV